MITDASATDEIAIDGCRVRVRLDGPESRPVLVLAHMLGTDLTLWDALVPELTPHFRVVRLDARGHGGSDVGAGAFGIDRLGRDVLAVLDHLGIARAHFCGLSMGGAVGLWLLAHAGYRIDRAVIAGAAAKLGTPESWNVRIAAARAEGMEQAVPATLERWFRRDFVEREPEKVEAVAALVRATSVEGFAGCCAALRDMDLREAVRGVSNRVLVLRGVDDSSATADGARALVEAMENAAVEELAASHCACVEDEAGFRSAVLRFLTAEAAPRRAATSRVAAKRGSAKPVSGTASAARRLGGRGLTAARRPVARTAPASKKAAATAEATRKIAARKPAHKTAARAEPARARAAGPARTGGRSASARAAVPKAVAVAKNAGKSSAGKSSAGKSSAGNAKVSTAKVSTAKVAKAGVAQTGRAATKVKELPSRTTAGRPGVAGKGASPKVAAAKTSRAKPVRTKAAVSKPAAKVSRSAKPAAKPASKPGRTKLSAAQLRARSAKTPKTKPPRRGKP